MITTGTGETLQDDGYVHYLDSGDSFTGVHACQNLVDDMF